MDLRRGDVVVVALQGDHGKPRPAIVIQGDFALTDSWMVAVLPLTSDPAAARGMRVFIKPTAANGLTEPSQTMIERLTTAPRPRIGARIGELEADTLAEIDNSLRLWLGLI